MSPITLTPPASNSTKILIKAYAYMYQLLVHADGEVSAKEVEFGQKMIEKEGLKRDHFDQELQQIALIDQETILKSAITSLKQLPVKDQTRCMAWLCVIANSDGFMDAKEWQLIYKIYYKELNLQTNMVMDEQKRISKEVYNSSSHGFGIKVNS